MGQFFVATSYPLRVIQLVVMLSSPWSLRITVIHVPRPVVVGGRKEFCSRAIPGPGPSQNSALSGTPAPKVQGTYAVRGVPGFSLAFSHIRSAGILPPPAAPLPGRSVIKSRVSGKASHTAFAASAPR